MGRIVFTENVQYHEQCKNIIGNIALIKKIVITLGYYILIYILDTETNKFQLNVLEKQ